MIIYCRNRKNSCKTGTIKEVLKYGAQLLFISHQIDSNETSGQSKNSTNTDLCQICGDKATVISEMNMNACRCYAACRLAKCFSMGMRSDLIRLWFIYLLCIKNY